MSNYASKVENGIVEQVIVGDVDWVKENFGGLWVGSDDKVGIGWTWDEINGFQPPIPPDTVE